LPRFSRIRSNAMPTLSAAVASSTYATRAMGFLWSCAALGRHGSVQRHYEAALVSSKTFFRTIDNLGQWM
jgi:hypothetical protein